MAIEIILVFLSTVLTVASGQDPLPCGSNITARSTPISLQLPAVQAGSVGCQWMIDAGSDDSLVMLEMDQRANTASCNTVTIYDGPTASEERRLWEDCSSLPPFHSIRSSSRYLYISFNISISIVEQSPLNMTFNVTSSTPGAGTEVLHADFYWSCMSIDLDSLDQGLRIRGAEKNLQNESTCIELIVASLPIVVNSVMASQFIYVFSGPDESFAELTKPCGTVEDNSRTMISRGSEIFIRKRENASSSLHQLWLLFRLQTKCVPKLIYLQSDTTAKILQSDFALQDVGGVLQTTSQYPNNAHCLWVMTPISRNYFVKASALNVSLYQYDYDNPQDGLIISRYYPAPVQSDAIIFYKSYWSDNFYPDVVSLKRSSLLAQFFTNSTRTATGFRLTYRSIPDLVSWSSSETIAVTEKSTKEITSPLYPQHYPGNLECYWRVEAPVGHIVILEVVDFNVSCSNPVRLTEIQPEFHRYLGNLCGNLSQTQYFSGGNAIGVMLQTGSPGDWTTFKFRLRSWAGRRACEGKVEHLKASDNKGPSLITSSGFPGAFPPNSNCMWRIEAPNEKMTVRATLFAPNVSDCGADSITFYDGYDQNSPVLGKFCGVKVRSLWSHKNYMFIHFVSDAITQYSGFRIHYWSSGSGPEDDKAQDDNDGSKETVTIGGVVGGLLLVIAIIGIICLACRCKKKNNDDSNSGGAASVPMARV